MNRYQPLLLIFLLLLFQACRYQERKDLAEEPAGNDRYAPRHYSGKPVLDSLMVDLVTYIGVKPDGATGETRFEQQFRAYYTEYSRQFKMIFLHKTEEGGYYFYLLRPARHLQGNHRGVGGKFALNNGQIESFEEIFNTPAGDEKTLASTGEILFPELVRQGNVDRFAGNERYIEWPDERLKYDKDLHEWRYEVK